MVRYIMNSLKTLSLSKYIYIVHGAKNDATLAEGDSAGRL